MPCLPTRVIGIAFVATAAATLGCCRHEQKSPTAELLSAYAAQTSRPFTLRLSELPYAPPPRVTRGGDSSVALSLQSAAHAVLAAPLTNRHDVDSAKVRASASMILGQPASAVSALKKELETHSKDGGLWNDYAVALYEVGRRDNDPQSLPAALAAADRAAALSGGSADAAFNRASILDALALRAAASVAWKHYLDLDPGSQWADEARRALADNQRPDQTKRWRTELPALEGAVAAGDTRAVDAAIVMFPQQIRTWGEGEYLSRWAELRLSGKDAEARQALNIARMFGDRLAAKKGEMLLQNAVAAIDRESPVGMDALARAHILYKRARLLVRDRKPSEADPIFTEAERAFAGAGSPMELVTLYYHAVAVFDQRSAERAIEYLDRIEARIRRDFLVLNAQVLGERARIMGRRDDPYGMLATATKASEIFARLGETENAAWNRIAVASMLFSLGRPKEAWRVRRETFEVARETGSAALLQQSLHNTVGAEMAEGHLDAAQSLLDVLIQTEGPSPLLRFSTHLSRAFVAYRLGEKQSATIFAQLQTATEAVEDPALRDEARDRLRFFEAVANGNTEPDRAIRLLDETIAFRRQTRRLSQLATAQFERARTLRSDGMLDEAAATLNAALETLETQRERVPGEDFRDSYFASAEDVCSELAEVHLSRGRPEQAFSAIDRCRARTLLDLMKHPPGTSPAVTLDEVQQKIPDGTALVLYAPLADQLMIWCVTRTKREFRSISVPRLAIESGLEGLRTAMQQRDGNRIDATVERLSDLLTKPIDTMVGIPERLVIVPDALLAAVPFSILQDRAGHALVERSTISLVPSAAVFTRAHPRHEPPRSALVLGDPSFLADVAGPLERLVAARDEARGIGAMYRQSVVLTDDAATAVRFLELAPQQQMIHLATHALLSARDARDSALALAPSGSDNGMLTLQRIALMKLQPNSIVVLAGCKTGAFGGGRGSIRSLSYAFLAAGSYASVGSLWDIDDETSRSFSFAFHQRILRAMTPASALRDTQLQMRRSHDPRLSHPAAWAGYQLYAIQ